MIGLPLLMLMLAPAAQPQDHARHAAMTGGVEHSAALLRGEGQGMARPADRAGYPGPRHVLDLADALSLSPEQRRTTEALFATMRTRAQALGRSLLAAEQDLAARFRHGRTDSAGIAAATLRIGRLRAQLQQVHLSAHVSMRALLRPEQVERYRALRAEPAPAVPAPAEAPSLWPEGAVPIWSGGPSPL